MPDSPKRGTALREALVAESGRHCTEGLLLVLAPKLVAAAPAAAAKVDVALRGHVGLKLRALGLCLQCKAAAPAGGSKL
jgi:hypothetical protein